MTGALYRLDRQEAALIQWWRGHETEGTRLALRLRAIAANPTPLALDELPVIAAMVERQEHQLDMVFREAREAYQRARTVAELARLTEVAP